MLLPRGRYTDLLIAGHDALEEHYFQLCVLEQFRADPSYRTSMNSLWGVGTNTSMARHIVLAESEDGEPAIMVRLCDLVELSPHDQERFFPYEIAGGTITQEIRKAVEEGEWPTDIDPLAALCSALEEINRLVEPGRLFRVDSSGTVRSTGEFLPLMFNSRKAYEGFAKTLDGLLSENLQHEFFDAASVQRDTPNGRPLGSIERVKIWLESIGSSDEDTKTIVEAFQYVRKTRQPVAHGLHEDDAEKDYRDMQDEIALTSISAIRRLCRVIAEGYRIQEWEPASFLTAPVRSFFPRDDH